MDTIPFEIIYHIIKFLHPRDIIAVCQISHRYRQIATDHHFWNHKLRTEFSIVRAEHNSISHLTCFQSYIKSWQRSNITGLRHSIISNCRDTYKRLTFDQIHMLHVQHDSTITVAKTIQILETLVKEGILFSTYTRDIDNMIKLVYYAYCKDICNYCFSYPSRCAEWKLSLYYYILYP